MRGSKGARELSALNSSWERKGYRSLQCFEKLDPGKRDIYWGRTNSCELTNPNQKTISEGSAQGNKKGRSSYLGPRRTALEKSLEGNRGSHQREGRSRRAGQNSHG